jgi:hypothetical protein
MLWQFWPDQNKRPIMNAAISCFVSVTHKVSSDHHLHHEMNGRKKLPSSVLPDLIIRLAENSSNMLRT